MGVLTWVLGQNRAVPSNYLSLELNEARINWFNAAPTYNSVVIQAANDAGGQGFVTELAGDTSKLKSMIWTQNDEQNWSSFQGKLYMSFDEFFYQAYALYGAWDGFWDATRASITLAPDVAFEDFKLCPNCYAGKIQFSPATKSWTQSASALTAPSHFPKARRFPPSWTVKPGRSAARAACPSRPIPTSLTLSPPPISLLLTKRLGRVSSSCGTQNRA